MPMKKIDSMFETLRAELKNGVYPVGGSFPSEYELAERFSVNSKTANKAVTLLCAEGFLERGGRGQGTRVASIGKDFEGEIVFLGNINGLYFSSIFSGISQAAFRKSFLPVLFSPPFQELNKAMERLSATKSVKGIVSCSYGTIQPGRFPIIYTDDHSKEHPAVNCIFNDGYPGTAEIMRTLFERGHRHIGIFFAPDLQLSRLEGFHSVMRKNGIENPGERTFFSSEDSIFDARAALKKIFAQDPETTAIVTGSDYDAFRIYKALQELKLEKSITLTGFGYVEGISTILPIATVDQHPFNLGFQAAEILIDIIRDGEPADPVCKMIDIEPVNLQYIPFLR